ncbi:hypothetical protein TNCV_3252611 [Trichonephila clavipes]|nr:hypothetical protein TNCV_3252611 [Trichonephila clavipes]
MEIEVINDFAMIKAQENICCTTTMAVTRQRIMMSQIKTKKGNRVSELREYPSGTKTGKVRIVRGDCALEIVGRARQFEVPRVPGKKKTALAMVKLQGRHLLWCCIPLTFPLRSEGDPLNVQQFQLFHMNCSIQVDLKLDLNTVVYGTIDQDH